MDRVCSMGIVYAVPVASQFEKIIHDFYSDFSRLTWVYSLCNPRLDFVPLRKIPLPLESRSRHRREGLQAGFSPFCASWLLASNYSTVHRLTILLLCLP